ncbi:MAG TPA: SH3 domain-containing protein [Alloacidobacterium sp.]|nr:SH3 domain-containing protein [Alloacidobacterium sp.]
MFFPVLFRFRFFFAFLLLPLGLAGCGRFSPRPHKEYVYVSARETYLRDRLAAVTNRVADVKNGERLEVLETDRRFYKVKTDKGAVGWTDDLVVIDQKTYDQFMALQKEHAHDPVVVTGVLRDESNLHIAPGRNEEHFYVLPENTRVQLLMRTSIEKPLPAQAVPVPLPAPPKKQTKKEEEKKKKRDPNAPPYIPPGPPMEDWWLVRGPQGQTGWVLSRMMDIDIPQEIAGLAESQRYVAAYKLTTVNDPESKFPDGQAPEYVAVTNAWRDGLPYDFDQVRVFTWVPKHHHYELAYRERGIEGYLPVTIGSMAVNGQTEPTFSFKVATSNDVAIQLDSASTAEAARPAEMTTETYRLEGDLVKKVEPTGAAAAPKAEATEAKKNRGKQARAPRKHRRKE